MKVFVLRNTRGIYTLLCVLYVCVVRVQITASYVWREREGEKRNGREKEEQC